MVAKKTIIVAYDKNRVIGHEGDMPWQGDLPADLEHFKKVTEGHTIVMGRKTYDSIGRPLPNRRNIVVSRQSNLQIPGCEVVHSLEDAYELGADDEEIFIIGGEKIFKLALEDADRLIVTEIDAEFEGDTYFPEIDAVSYSGETQEERLPDDKNKYGYTVLRFDAIGKVAVGNIKKVREKEMGITIELSHVETTDEREKEAH